MAGFSERSGWYKFAVLCLALGFSSLVFGVGFPAWSHYDLLGSTFQAGLWQLCTENLDECTTYDLGKQQEWFEAVRGLEALGILLYIITLGVAVKQSCTPPQNNAPEGHTLTVLSFITGAMSMSGVIVYGTQISLGIYGTFAISYWLALLGSGAAFGAAFFLSINRRSYRGAVIHPVHIRQAAPRPPPYNRHARVTQPSVHVIGGPMQPGYPQAPDGQPPGYTMTHGLSPGYPPREGYNQGYPGPPPAYNSLPGQIHGVGAWPTGNQVIPPPPKYTEEVIKQ